MVYESITIEEQVIIRQKVEIGEKTVIKCGAIIGTGVKIGRRCYIGPGAMLLHMDTDGKSTPACVGNDVFIGAGAIILPDVTIEDGVIIGAGAVVIRGRYDKGTYVGNPVRKLK